MTSARPKTLLDLADGATAFQYRDSRRISHLFSMTSNPHQTIAAEVGPAYWDYRRRWDLASSFQLELPFPLQVDYELVYACNLRCPICLMSLPFEERQRWGDPGQRLSIDTVKMLLDEGAAKGQAAVGLNGVSEPLLSPELPEIIAYARAKGMLDVMFNTNGLLLTEEISRQLIRAGLTRIMISLDAATAQTYHRIRIGSDFEQVTENVRRFLRLRQEMRSRLPIVRLSFCVTSLNEDELDDFINIWRGQVDLFSIQQYGNAFDGPYALDRSRFFPRRYKYQPSSDPRCNQPFTRVMVRHNGEVIPCCDVSGLSQVIGNIHHEDLGTIWHGPAANRIQRLHLTGRFNDDPICRQCMTKWGPTHPS